MSRPAPQSMPVDPALLHRLHTADLLLRLGRGLAHDIRNAAQVLALVEPSPDGRWQSELDQCADELTHTSDALGLLGSRQDEPVQSLGEVLTTAIRLAERGFAAACNIRFEVEAAINPYPVSIGKRDLLTAMLAVLLNAGDAMAPVGGVVTVRLIPGPPPQIHIDDNGPGWSPESRAKAFDPFFSTKGPEALGLGLTVAHNILAAAGGSIEFLDVSPGVTRIALRFRPGVA